MKYIAAMFIFWGGLFSCKEDSDYLKQAEKAAAWIVSTADSGMYAWPDIEGDSIIASDLASGIAGRTLFFLQMYQITGDHKYRKMTLQSARALRERMYTMRLETQHVNSFYYGRAGVAWMLHESGTVFQDSNLIRSANMYLDSILSDFDGRSFSRFNDVLFGDAGTGLFLLYAADKMRSTVSMKIAIKIGNALMDSAIREERGMHWRFRKGAPIVLPNFSHGTAGIGYFFASLYEKTGDTTYKNVAVEAARYLFSIAKTDNGSSWIPYGWPNKNWEGRYDIGWAHGPAGTGRFFRKLFIVTGDSIYNKWTNACAQSIIQSGFPGKPQAFLMDSAFKMDWRFGLTGAGMFLFDIASLYSRSDYSAMAFALADSIKAQAILANQGVKWVIKSYPFMQEPGKPVAFTGLFYGASGMGWLMLRAHTAINHGEANILRLPDDPF